MLVCSYSVLCISTWAFERTHSDSYSDEGHGLFSPVADTASGSILHRPEHLALL